MAAKIVLVSIGTITAALTCIIESHGSIPEGNLIKQYYKHQKSNYIVLYISAVYCYSGAQVAKLDALHWLLHWLKCTYKKGRRARCPENFIF